MPLYILDYSLAMEDHDVVRLMEFKWFFSFLGFVCSQKKHLDVFKLWIDTCFHVFLGVMRWILRFINSIKPRSFIASFRSLFRTQSNIYDGAILRK